MKKFLLIIIFIIPIVVVMALSATGVIISSTTPVNARHMSIRDSFNQEIDTNKPLVVDISSSDDFVVVELLPTITNQSIIYEIDDIPDSGDLMLEQIGDSNHYSIVPLVGGYTRVLVRAANNRDLFMAFTVFVRDKTIKKLSVYDEDGQTVENIEINAPTKLFCDVNPITALENNIVNWGTDNEKVAAVSDNGLVTPVSSGKTRVWVSVLDTMGNTHTKYVVVDTTQALVKTNQIFSPQAVNAEWLYNNIIINKKASVSQLDNNRYKVQLDNKTEIVEILKANDNEWDFVEKPDTLYTQNGPFFPTVAYISGSRTGEKVNAKITVSDIMLAKMAGNALIPLHSGMLDVMAEYGGITKSMRIQLRERPLFFNLSLNREDASLGIKMDRVWGINWYNDDMTFTNSYKLSTSLATNEGDILWETDNDFATVSQEGMVTFLDTAIGQSITVTATAMVGNYRTPLQRQFTFKISQDVSAINISSNKELFNTINNKAGATVIMQDNIKVDSSIKLTGNLFGNGFMLDAKDWNINSRYTNIIEIEQNRLPKDLEELIVEDFIIEAESSYEKAKEQGVGLYTHKLETPLLIKNAIIRYVNDGIMIKDSKNVRIEGCILGDSAFSAIMFLNDSPADADLLLKNNIIKETPGPSMFMANHTFNLDKLNENVVPRITIDGFLDIYNWKTASGLKSMLSGIDEGILSGVAHLIKPEVIMDAVGSVISTIFTRDDMQHLSYYDAKKKEKYYCMGMFALGIYNIIDASRFDIKDDGLVLLDFKLPTDKTDVGKLVSLMEAALSVVDKKFTILNPNYILSYDVSGKDGPRNKPGDPVPQNKELYLLLNSYYAEH